MSEEKDVPSGWVWTTLGECCIVERGITFPASAKTTHVLPGTIACLRTANIQEAVDWNDLIYVPREYMKADSKLIRPGDILISVANSRELVGKVALIETVMTESTLGGFIAAIRCDKSLDSKFFFYYLRQEAVKRAFSHSSSQTVNIANISLGDIYSTQIYLPPLAEQRRIVAAIEQQFTRLDAGVAALKRSQAALKRYRAAVLKAAVEGRLTEAWRAAHPATEPATRLLARILAERRARWEADLRAKGKDPAKAKYAEPKAPDTASLPQVPVGWTYTFLDPLLSTERKGMTTGPFGTLLSKQDYASAGIPVVGIENISAMRFMPGGKVFISRAKADELANYATCPGDVVISRSGTVGEVCVIPEGLGEARISTNLMRVSLAKDGLMPQLFCLLFNGSPFVLSQVDELCKGSTRSFLNQHILSSLYFPLPPIAEQEQIVAEVERRLSVVAALEATIAANLKRAERLRQAILERAFTGRLVPQDPDDEPASALLERIRREREAAGAATSNGKRNGRLAAVGQRARAPRQAPMWGETSTGE